MTDTADKHRRLVEMLFERTVDESLSWEVASWIGDFQSKIGSRYVSLKKEAGEFDEDDYYVYVLDDGYNELDRFSDMDISETDFSPAVGNFKNHYLLMESLYRTVKRQISGADKALDDILDQLSKA